MFGYTVFVSSFSYLTKTDKMGGGGFSPHMESVPFLCVYSVLLYYFYSYGLVDTFCSTSTTVLLCLEARLQEKVEEMRAPPHFRDVTRTGPYRSVLVHLYIIRLQHFHELEF